MVDTKVELNGQADRDEVLLARNSSEKKMDAIAIKVSDRPVIALTKRQ